jgi:hypothetical protein
MCERKKNALESTNGMRYFVANYFHPLLSCVMAATQLLHQ